MATLMKIRSVQEGYWDVVHAIRQRGHKVAPRGIETWELENVVLEVSNPIPSLPLWRGRGVSKSLAAVEALQLIAGETVPELVVAVAPNYDQFMSHTPGGITQDGAYGPRIRNQMLTVVDMLREQPDTRQAVVGIWSPKDLGADSPDIPCTVFLRFAVRSDHLHMTTVMRSNDVWWGLAYDAFQFTQLQVTLARCLGMRLGTYTHVVNSMHLYQRDVKYLKDQVYDWRLFTDATGIGSMPDMPWDWYEDRARNILLGQRRPLPSATKSEKWYAKELKAYQVEDE